MISLPFVRGAALVWLVASSLVGVRGQSGYDARRAEIRATLVPYLDGSKVDSLDRALQVYCDGRKSTLEDALELLEDSDDDSFAKAWREHFKNSGVAALKLLDLGKDRVIGTLADDRKAEFRKHLTQVVRLESVFFHKLSLMPAARLRDDLIQYRGEFEDAADNLEDKWTDITDRDQSIDDAVAKTRAEIDDIYSKCLKTVAAARPDLEAWVLKVADAIEAGNDLASAFATGLPSEFLPGPGDIALTYFKRVNEFSDKYERLVKQLNTKFKQETVVHVLFAETREDVEDFLAKTNLDAAAKQLDEARSRMEQLARDMATKAQQDDAAAFVKDAIEVIDNHFDEFEAAYEEFVDEWEGIFLGPIASQTCEELVEKDSRNAWREGVRKRQASVQGSLQQLYDASRDEFFDVSISGLKPDQRKLLGYLLKIQLTKVVPLVDKLRNSLSLVDRMWLSALTIDVKGYMQQPNPEDLQIK